MKSRTGLNSGSLWSLLKIPRLMQQQQRQCKALARPPQTPAHWGLKTPCKEKGWDSLCRPLETGTPDPFLLERACPPGAGSPFFFHQRKIDYVLFLYRHEKGSKEAKLRGQRLPEGRWLLVVLVFGAVTPTPVAIQGLCGGVITPFFWQ